jgi:hypothetical protein
MVSALLVMLGLRCPEYIWPEMRFPSCRCVHGRWHRGAHHDRSGDAWEGKRR